MDILQAMDQLQVCYRYATATYGIYRPTAPYGFRGKSPEFADGCCQWEVIIGRL